MKRSLSIKINFVLLRHKFILHSFRLKKTGFAKEYYLGYYHSSQLQLEKGL